MERCKAKVEVKRRGEEESKKLGEEDRWYLKIP